MDEHVKDTIDVSLSATSDPSCSVSHSNKIEEELFYADLHIRVKQEDSSINRSDIQVKFEAPDVQFASDRVDICMKLEHLESDTLALEMDEHVKVKDTIEVSLSATSDPSCRVSHSNEIKEELFCVDLNTLVKQEDSSIHSSDIQVKSEAPDVQFGIASDTDDIYMKLEPLESEELLIKDEINQSATEKPTQVEYFCCGLCSKKFTYKRYLSQHMKIHTGEKPFKCDLCDYSGMRKDTLSNHIKTHTGEKPFQCSACDYRCAQKSNLLMHIKGHTGEKPIKCGICDYSCIRKSDLLKHIKTHMGEKPFKCGICNYSCIDKGNFSLHINTHTGEKPYECTICDYKCIRKSDLTIHIKRHTEEKPFQCGVCNYKFVRKNDLSRHIKTHSGEKPFKCSVCEFRCVRKYNLQNHMKTHIK